MKMNLTTSEKNRGIVRFLLMSMLLCLLIHPAQAQDRVTVTGRLTEAPMSGVWLLSVSCPDTVTRSCAWAGRMSMLSSRLIRRKRTKPLFFSEVVKFIFIELRLILIVIV